MISSASSFSVPADVTSAGAQGISTSNQTIEIVNVNMGTDNFEKVQAIITGTSDTTNCPIPAIVNYKSNVNERNISVPGLPDACEYEFQLSPLCDGDTLTSANNVSNKYCTSKLKLLKKKTFTESFQFLCLDHLV